MTNRSRRAALLAALATLVLAASLAVAGSATGAGTGSTYIVVYKQQAVPTDAADSIAQAGGTLVYAYDQIGVAIASADSATFASALAQDNRVDGVSATAQFGTRVEDDAVTDAVGDPTPAIPAPGNDTLSGLQWDMTQIHAPEARAINGGSPAVVVGDIDTGLDYTHPDLAPNVDFANSVSCLGGVPDRIGATGINNFETYLFRTDAGSGRHSLILGNLSRFSPAKAQVFTYYGETRLAHEVALEPKAHTEVALASERDGHRLERVEVKALFRLASYVVGRHPDGGELVLFDHLFSYFK